MSDSDDDEVWEQVWDSPQDTSEPLNFPDVPEPSREATPDETEDGRVLEIILNRQPGLSKEERERRKQESLKNRQEMILRHHTHKLHTYLLLWSGLIRNRYTMDELLKARLLSMVPEEICQALHFFNKNTHPNERDRSRLFERGMRFLTSWWFEEFAVRGNQGIRYRRVADVMEELNDQGTKTQSSRILGDVIHDEKSLMKAAVRLKGSRDTCALLFTSLCRSLNIPARLIQSLQPLDWKASAWKNDTESLRATNARYVVPYVLDVNILEEPPVFWTEVYNRYLKQWVVVDPVRGKFRCRDIMEPETNQSRATNRMLYVIAYEEDGHIRDVTKRYAQNFYSYTMRLRARDRQGAHSADWMQTRVVPMFARKAPLKRDEREDEELEARALRNSMPTSYEHFKTHPMYTLERHLHKDQMIAPQAKPVSTFRGSEKVYLKTDVMTLHSKDYYWRHGRIIKPGQEPRKYTKPRSTTINRKRQEFFDEQIMLSGPVEVALFSDDQTQTYVPKPIGPDGLVPKNSFGNIDLYVPSMLPEGGAFIKHPKAEKIARELEIDFALAVTGFDYKQRRATPVISGIVVAEQYEYSVKDALFEYDRQEKEKRARKEKIQKLEKLRRLKLEAKTKKRLEHILATQGSDDVLVNGESQLAQGSDEDTEGENANVIDMTKVGSDSDESASFAQRRRRQRPAAKKSKPTRKRRRSSSDESDESEDEELEEIPVSNHRPVTRSLARGDRGSSKGVNYIELSSDDEEDDDFEQKQNLKVKLDLSSILPQTETEKTEDDGDSYGISNFRESCVNYTGRVRY